MAAEARISPALGRQLSSKPSTLGNVAYRQNGAASESVGSECIEPNSVGNFVELGGGHLVQRMFDPMLAPDKATATTALQSSISSAAVITVYAGALRYTVAPLLTAAMPAWFAPVKASIATVVTNATNWMDDLCIDVTTVIPNSVIAFASTFDTVSDQINNIETEIMMSSGVATPGQKQQAVDALTVLKAGIDKANGDVAAIDARLLDLTNLVQADHDALATGSRLVAQNIPDGSVISQSMTVDLGNDFLNITPNGPCMVSIDIKSDVMIRITQTAGAHPELLPFVIAQKLIDNAIADNAKATTALSSVRAVWSLMEGLVKSAIDDVSMAADENVLPVLRQAEFAAARDVWDQLSSTARSLMQGG